MNIQVREAPAFQKDFKKLGALDREITKKRLNILLPLIIKDNKGFFTHVVRPVTPVLRGGLTSTCFALRLNPRLRVIFTYTEDPIFDVLTYDLLRVLPHDLYEREFLKTATSYYEKLGLNPTK